MNVVVLYCRPGFEKECAAEIQDKTARLGFYGFAKTEPQSGYVTFQCYDDESADLIVRRVRFSGLIFARQFFAATLIEEMDINDRIRPIVAQLRNMPNCGDLRVETADTNEAKELSKFCRKFTVPLRKTLRERSFLTNDTDDNLPCMHVMFTDTHTAWIGYSYPENSSPYLMGIPRLRFPSDAPSRSTLKLEEAFQLFVTQDQDTRLTSGLNAVDLGAAPGGWTYQLVKRGMMVSAVDNGPMDERLMETGQVKHCREDGFTFLPKKHNVYWLVCDMVEKPSRVSRLVVDWFEGEWCQEAMFNLKLPMKKRFEVVRSELDTLREMLKEIPGRYWINCKQLYHDREEVTVHVRRLPKVN